MAVRRAGTAVPVRGGPGPQPAPHRCPRGALRTVAAILANPRYTGRQVRNRQRTDFDLAILLAGPAGKPDRADRDLAQLSGPDGTAAAALVNRPR